MKYSTKNIFNHRDARVSPACLGAGSLTPPARQLTWASVWLNFPMRLSLFIIISTVSDDARYL